MRSIRRRDTGESYREMLVRMAQERGVPTATAAELKQFDRARKGKRLSNAEWASPTDSAAKITPMQDGRRCLAYKPEHAVDLDTKAIVAAAIHVADHGDTTTLAGTLAAAKGLSAPASVRRSTAPPRWSPTRAITAAPVLTDLADGQCQTRIAEPKPKDVQRWRGDLDTRLAVYGNRVRLRSGIGKEGLALRAKVERSFVFTLDPGGLRRTHVRGRENVQRRCLVHVAGYHLGLLVILIPPPEPRPEPTSSTGC